MLSFRANVCFRSIKSRWKFELNEYRIAGTTGKEGKNDPERISRA